MAKKYSILKEVTTTYIVCEQKEGDLLVEPIARTTNKDAALTIKGFYEKAEENDNARD